MKLFAMKIAFQAVVEQINKDNRDRALSDKEATYWYILRLCTKTTNKTFQMFRNSIWDRIVDSDGQFTHTKKCDKNAVELTYATSIYKQKQIQKKFDADYPHFIFPQIEEKVFVGNISKLILEYLATWADAEQLDDNFAMNWTLLQQQHGMEIGALYETRNEGDDDHILLEFGKHIFNIFADGTAASNGEIFQNLTNFIVNCPSLFRYGLWCVVVLTCNVLFTLKCIHVYSVLQYWQFYLLFIYLVIKNVKLKWYYIILNHS